MLPEHSPCAQAAMQQNYDQCTQALPGPVLHSGRNATKLRPMHTGTARPCLARRPPCSRLAEQHHHAPQPRELLFRGRSHLSCRVTLPPARPREVAHLALEAGRHGVHEAEAARVAQPKRARQQRKRLCQQSVGPALAACIVALRAGSGSMSCARSPLACAGCLRCGPANRQWTSAAWAPTLLWRNIFFLCTV